MNVKQILELLPQRRLTRSQSVEIFFKLDHKGQPSINEIINLSLAQTIKDINKDDESALIDDPEERAEAYRDLCNQLKTIISSELRKTIISSELIPKNSIRLALTPI